MKSPLLFDLDDTLIESTQHYIETREAFYVFLQQHIPAAPQEEIEEELNRIGNKWAQQPAGYDRDRFPVNLIQTYQAIANRYDHTPQPEVAQQLYELGSEVFEAPNRPYKGVVEMLGRYQQAGFPMGLITKGDFGIQQRKIQDWDLQAFFDEIRCVDRGKKPEDFLDLTRALGATGEGTMVGDSLRDDIANAGQAGLTTVLVDEDVRERSSFLKNYNANIDARPDHVIPRVTQLPTLVALPELSDPSLGGR